MSRLTNRYANKADDAGQRLRAAAVRMYLFTEQTAEARDELISIRREISGIIRDMMGDYYREEAAGTKARQEGQEHEQG